MLAVSLAIALPPLAAWQAAPALQGTAAVVLPVLMSLVTLLVAVLLGFALCRLRQYRWGNTPWTLTVVLAAMFLFLKLFYTGWQQAQHFSATAELREAQARLAQQVEANTVRSEDGKLRLGLPEGYAPLAAGAGEALRLAYLGNGPIVTVIRFDPAEFNLDLRSFADLQLRRLMGSRAQLGLTRVEPDPLADFPSILQIVRLDEEGGADTVIVQALVRTARGDFQIALQTDAALEASAVEHVRTMLADFALSSR